MANIKAGKLKDADLMKALGQAGGAAAGMEALPYLFDLFGGEQGEEVDYDTEDYRWQ